MLKSTVILPSLACVCVADQHRKRQKSQIEQQLELEVMLEESMVAKSSSPRL